MIAAVAVVGGLCLLDLLLTFGVIRRLREHTSMLTAAGGPADPPLGLSAGEFPAAFSAVNADGEPVSGAAGLRLVAFFAAWCSVCPERVPPFMEYLASHHIARDSVLVVVADGDSAPPPYLAELAPVARICVEPGDGEIMRAFKVAGFPAFFLLDANGAVALSGYDPAALPEPATV
jgi:hypothetical protein